MPTGPQRAKPKNPRGPNKVEAKWHGGPNYASEANGAMLERESFKSMSHARSVMQSRIGGWDPVSGLQTPVVQDSAMDLYRPGSVEPFQRLSQTNRGIKRERY
jgi:hypothetical protein